MYMHGEWYAKQLFFFFISSDMFSGPPLLLVFQCEGRKPVHCPKHAKRKECGE